VTREGFIQLACLYGPLASACLLAWWLRPSKKLATGLIFATAWTAALLPWLDSAAQLAGLWSYHSQSVKLAGMPLALYLGWVIAWGIVAPLLARALGNKMWLSAAFLILLDLRTMPEMKPVLELHSLWWVGEIGMTSLLLLPALFIARSTESGQYLSVRCSMLVPAFGGIFLGLPVLLELGNVMQVFVRWSLFSEIHQLLFVLGIGIFSIPGLAAVRDLALSGEGTPVPLDPPKRLVTHGIYAFVRNPMQISMTLLLLLESLFLWSPWPLVLALLGIIYSEGFARWSESQDMHERFGQVWKNYHQSLRPWAPHWHPKISDACELWIDMDCSPCSEVASWFERHHPKQLEILAAAKWEGSPLLRITWRDPASKRTESGIAAIAMALQHIHLGWAMFGWLIGLPGISHILQICFDAVGTGKRAAAMDKMG
jgi:protein-S-isoprenylcysteine O-methyltransferase Ste14